MIKATINQGKTILLGITEENIALMKQGRPIKVSMKEMNLEDRDIIIMYGKTDKDLYLDVKGLINEKTIIHGTPPEENNHADKGIKS